MVRGRPGRRLPGRRSAGRGPSDGGPSEGRGRRLRLERHDGYWLLVGIAAPGAAATTLGPLILMRHRAVGNARLLRHELVHVRQWRVLGVGGFLVRYLGAYLRWRARGYPHWAAYRRIPLEIEAEWEARRDGRDRPRGPVPA